MIAASRCAPHLIFATARRRAAPIAPGRSRSPRDCWRAGTRAPAITAARSASTRRPPHRRTPPQALHDLGVVETEDVLLTVRSDVCAYPSEAPVSVRQWPPKVIQSAHTFRKDDVGLT